MTKISTELDKEVKINYGLNDNDRSKYMHTSSASDVSDLDKMIAEPLEANINSILNAQRLSSSCSPQKDTSVDLIMTAASTAPTKGPVSTRGAVAKNTGRYASVVVVRSTDGTVGAAFYVTPDTLITNFHVVAGKGVLNIATADRQTGQATVMYTDAVRDLAIMTTKLQGIPAELSTSIPEPGTTVEVIGHPKGLTFSITRGIVSAVREMPNPDFPNGRPVLYVQTDAAMNPGNSGGPLMANGRVIGVGTWKISSQIAEGVGFAVHSKEIQDFMRANNVAFAR